MAYDEWKKIDVFRAVQYTTVYIYRVDPGSLNAECFRSPHSYTTKKGTSS